MLIPHQALIVVADGKKFLLLRNLGDLEEPLLVFEGNGEKENPSTKMQGTDQPGRHIGYGSARSAMEPTDFHQLEEDRFARDVAELLERLAEADDYQKLIVVAPPRTLAELRKHFAKEVCARIIAEIDKDLTKHSVDKIAAILSQSGGD